LLDHLQETRKADAMTAKTKEQYAAEGIAISKREGEAGYTTQYVRGHKQWVKVIRDAKQRRWTFARGYEGVVTAHTREQWSIASLPTWDDAIDHAARLIHTWK
jgi:hypothetical protein